MNTKKYKNKRVREPNIVDTFTINGQKFNIQLTNHAGRRLKDRNIDSFQAISAILSLGEKKLLSYINTNKDIVVIDKEHNFSIVFSISDNIIYIITVIEKVASIIGIFFDLVS